jgi:DNA-binding PadR family transcriptional regulator
VLGQLDEERYGYSLKKSLAAGGLDVDEGTLYPLLRRLEARGLLDSDWRVEDGRPRRYYRLNDTGRAALADLKGAWAELTTTIEGLL